MPTTEQISRRKRTHSDPAPDRQPPRKRTHREAEPKQVPEGAPRTREPRRTWERLPKWVRQITLAGRIRIDKFQVLIPAGNCRCREYPANFGCYPSVKSAVEVRNAVIHRLRPGISLWTILAELKVLGLVPGKVMPTWVRVVPGGFAGRCRWAGVDKPGPYRTPEEAHDAVRVVVDRKREYLPRRRAMQTAAG